MPALLHPIFVLEEMEEQDAKPQVMPYQMLMQSLAASGQVETSFELLRQVETSGLLSHFHED